MVQLFSTEQLLIIWLYFLKCLLSSVTISPIFRFLEQLILSLKTLLLLITGCWSEDLLVFATDFSEFSSFSVLFFLMLLLDCVTTNIDKEGLNFIANIKAAWIDRTLCCFFNPSNKSQYTLCSHRCFLTQTLLL